MKTGLSAPQKNILLDLARKTIGCQFNAGEDAPRIPKDEVFHKKTATFVTLKISGKLRGCIGHLEPVTSLWKSVRDNARSAAFHDHRFSALSLGELEKLEIDISILSSPSLLEYTDSDDLLKKLQPGIDGVVLSDGRRGATFLPQVWEQLQSAEQFLGQLCRKAGLEETAWLAGNLEIKVYRVLYFGGGRPVKEVVLPEKLLKQLQTIYGKLEREYDNVAGLLGFSCVGCHDNCCDSYFLHHTYAEWAFLWLGFSRLDPAEQKEILKKSQNYIKQSDAAKKSGERPLVMCPLNEKGLCVLYEYRLLVCRTHGVPAALTRPDGQKLRFPGCFRCQEVVQRIYGKVYPPHVERTPLLREFVLLEDELLDNRRSLIPKVRVTIAEMIVKGPPVVPVLHCQK